MDKNDALRAMAIQYEMQDNTPLAQRRAYSDVEDARGRYNDRPPPAPPVHMVTHGVAIPPPRLPHRPAGAPRLLLLFFCILCVMTTMTVGAVLMVLPLYDRFNSDGTSVRPKQQSPSTPLPAVRNRTQREIMSTSLHTLRRRIDELDTEMARNG